jgi:hypothetical protein
MNSYVNGAIYKYFLNELFQKLGGEKIALLFDGFSVHNSYSVWQIILKKYKWIGILNIAYSTE